jgi:purine-binding chemotaxis protein CheW
MEQQFVVFDLAGEHYGVNIAAVEGIIKLQAITAVPHAPTFVEGVTNHRGKVLPVVDLRRRFGLPRVPPTKDTRIVVVEMGGATVGLVVDGVSEVLRVDPASIEPPSPMVASAETTFIRGIAKLGQQLVILLDLAHVLSEQDQARLLQLPAAAAAAS